MGLGLTVKPFYVYVLTLKMNQSLSQNIRHINTTLKILWGPILTLKGDLLISWPVKVKKILSCSSENLSKIVVGGAKET